MRAALAPDESLSYEFVTLTNHDSKIASRIKKICRV
jgi:hypothetical protein